MLTTREEKQAAKSLKVGDEILINGGTTLAQVTSVYGPWVCFRIGEMAGRTLSSLVEKVKP